MPRLREFSFEGLPQWTRRQVALQESFATYLSYRPFSRGFRSGLAAEIGKQLKVPFKLGRGVLSVTSVSELPRILPDLGCAVVLGTLPSEHKIVVDLDLSLVSYSIDRILGGDGQAPRIKRQLTEIEMGVISFLFLKALEYVQAGWHSGRELNLSLDRIVSTPQEIVDALGEVEHLNLLSFRLAADKTGGSARVLIPEAMIEEHFSANTSQALSGPDELKRMRRMLNAIGEQEVDAKVEIARLDLSSEERAGVEVGDIVILENHDVSLTSEGLQGHAFLRIGRGENGGARGNIIHSGEFTKLQLMEIVVSEEPTEEPMMNDESEQPGESVEEAPFAQDTDEQGPIDNLQETEGLLRDIAAPVVVELGRLKLNTQQVVKLRAGQVIRLPRGTKDPVNLVVNNKLFARGELVEVDGELGVRLVQITGR
jgi:flagellar motor switch protein FliM